MASDELADLELRIWSDDPERAAILAGNTDDKKDAVWLPRSMVEIEYTTTTTATVTMPQWMAENRGLV